MVYIWFYFVISYGHIHFTKNQRWYANNFEAYDIQIFYYMQSNDNQVNNILWSNNLVEIYIVKILFHYFRILTASVRYYSYHFFVHSIFDQLITKWLYKMFELAVHRLTFIREHCLFSRILHRKRCTSVIRRKFDFRQFIQKLYNEI